MATKITTFNAASTPLSFKRINPIPLDSTSVFDDLSKANSYSHTDPTAYVGQLLVADKIVGINRYTDEPIHQQTLYVIDDESGNLREIGAVDQSVLNDFRQEIQGDITNIRQMAAANLGAMKLQGFINTQEQLDMFTDPEMMDELSELCQQQPELLGYTLRFAANLSAGGVDYKVGDLITLYEGEWVHIPSGDELEATPISLALIGDMLENTDHYSVVDGEIVDDRD